MGGWIQTIGHRRSSRYHMTNYSLPTVMSEMMTPYASSDWHDYYTEVLNLIPQGSRVLDIGCGRGGLAAWLRDNRACTPVCVDASLNAVESCRAKGLVAHHLDIERSNPPCEGGFDAIIFLSSLESLIDPLAVVRRVRPLLRPHGTVVIWLPNFSYFRALFAYLKGKAPKCIGNTSQARGLGVRGYDDVQFFTKETLETMLVEAGYTNIQWSFHKGGNATVRPRRKAWAASTTLLRLRALKHLRFLLSPSLCVIASSPLESGRAARGAENCEQRG